VIQPTLSAALNAAAAVLLACGYRAIRRGDRETHKRFMVGALAASTLFLANYLVYHARVGSVPYDGPGRPLYLVLLVSHVVLAAAIVPLVALTVVRAARGQFERHRRIARWTLPVWMYVSVTGVVIYLVLYLPG
jgi:uncharacterized membrane protein YozB (DUF420 family)